MTPKKGFLLLLMLSLSYTIVSCSDNDDTLPPPEVYGEETGDPNDDSTDPMDDNEDPTDNEGDDGTLGTVEVFNENLVADNYILVNDAGNDRVFLMDKQAKLLHEWPLPHSLGNDAFLLPDGRILASLEADEAKITFGGQGGRLQFLDKEGTTLWNFDYSSSERETHHDAELLPNGNILALVWEKKTVEEASAAGSNLDIDVFPEAVIEVNPNTDEIVWEWHAWDHLVQDHEASKENFGVIADNPHLIDLNYVPDEKGDIMHANGIDYDEINDLIFISVNFYHEVWVIDHSTSTAEAASHSGGNTGKGGDLVYRFGNPAAYQNNAGERLFHNNHFPNLLKGNDQGKIMIFSNGAELEQSTAYELQLPNPLELRLNTDNEPLVIWSFTDADLYSPKVSGVAKLPNGNRLITEGDFGIWEVTETGEVVWKFSGEGFFWRAYPYDRNASEILSLNLN